VVTARLNNGVLRTGIKVEPDVIAAVQNEATFRAELGRILAALISQLGDFPLAEDALQDALVNALERWEADGIPATPAPGCWRLHAAAPSTASARSWRQRRSVWAGCWFRC
jgi:predicted RNA polymerase sigma factor